MKNTEAGPETKITILFFPFNLLSHYLRSLVLADSYDRHQYNILFLSSERYDAFVHQHQYKTFSCLQFNEDDVMSCIRRFEFDWLKQSVLEQIMLAQVNVIKSLGAEIVIGDMAPTLKMAAECCRVPYYSLMNGYMTKHYAATRKISKRHQAFPVFKTLPRPLANWLTSLGESVTMRQIHYPFRQLRAQYQLKYVANYISEMEGDQNLICDLPHLFPQRVLPINYAFTGPLIYQPAADKEQWIAYIDVKKPLILVAMGSTGDWRKLEFLNQEFYSKYTVVTAGDAEGVLHAPHIISRTFVNMMEVLERADLMICHGGNGTIYHGILAAVYMLCISSHFEQEWNIEALENNSYGKSADDFDEPQWRHAINYSIEHRQLYRRFHQPVAKDLAKKRV